MHDIRDRHAASRPWTISACWLVLGAVVLAQYAATAAGMFGLKLATPWGGGALWTPGLAPVVALAGFAVLWPHRGRAGQKPLWDTAELNNPATWGVLGITVSLNLLLVLLFQGSTSAGAFCRKCRCPFTF